MALTAYGRKALRRVQRGLKQRHRKGALKFEMETYYSFNTDGLQPIGEQIVPEGFCNTTACIAGTLVLNEGFKPLYSPSSWAPKQLIRGEERLMPDDVKERAIELLGVSYADGLALFEPMNYPSAIWKGLRYNRKRDVIKAIDRFIRRNGKLTRKDLENN